MNYLAFIAGTTLCVAAAAADITPMTTATGSPLISRLLEGSGLDMTSVPANQIGYVGLTAFGAQAGLLSGLTLRGAEGTSQTLGSGIVLSSGRVDNIPSNNTTSAYSNVTSTGGNNYFRDFPAQTGSSRHGGRLQEHDTNSITFDLDVPEGVVGLTTQFVYASEEYPEWSGTQYADGFGFFVEGVNYARLPDGRPVSLLSASDNIHFMTNGDSFDLSVPTVADLEYDGMTRILELTAPLSPGRLNTITIVVADTGDEIYDSAVFLSSLRFINGTAPLNPDDCSVHLRHHSSDDESYVEFGLLPVPAPCLPDITQIGGTAEAPGTPDGQVTVDDIIVFVNLFSDGGGCPGAGPCNRADVTAIGGLPASPDGELTVDDIIAFFNAFSDGCGS